MIKTTPSPSCVKSGSPLPLFPPREAAFAAPPAAAPAPFWPGAAAAAPRGRCSTRFVQVVARRRQGGTHRSQEGWEPVFILMKNEDVTMTKRDLQ